MADKRIIEQNASTTVPDDAFFIFDSALLGTFKISRSALLAFFGESGTQALEEIANAIAENYDSTETYNKDDFAFYNNKLYRCLANNTTGTWDSSKWKEFDLPTDLITTAHNIETAEFTIGTYYSADDLVLKDGKLYQCVVGHNATEWKSQFWRSVTIDEMLGYLSDSIAPEHNQSTVYAVGDLVMHNKILWRCTQAGAGAFVNANWEEVTVVSLIAEAGKIDDVQVKTTGDYETVVENKIAKIDLSSVTAYGEVPNLPQAIATFKDGADAPMKSLKVAIEPVQDLHGYDAPWVGGAGKNKLQVTATTLTTQNVTFTVNDDGTISTSGTATGDIDFYVGAYTSTGATYSASGCPSDGATDSTYWMFFGYMGADSGSGVSNKTIASGNNITARIYVKSGVNMNGKVFKPMIEVGSTISTFAPYSNICPISGWTGANIYRYGKNLFDKNATITGYLGSDGSVVASGSFDHEFIPIVGGNEYTISGINFNGGPYSWWYDRDTNPISSFVRHNNGTFTAPSNACYMGINAIVMSNQNHDIDTIQVEVGATATTYEPYNGSTTTIPFVDSQGNPVEVYGGSVDLVSGVMVVDRIYKQVKDFDWRTQSGYYGRFFTVPSGADKALSDSNKSLIISDTYKGYSDADKPANTNGVYIGSGGSIKVWDSEYNEETDIDAWKTARANVELCYYLATPIEIQLTPTAVKSLLGQNNIWADTGDINECVYRRDMSSTIDDIIARLEALEG